MLDNVFCDAVQKTQQDANDLCIDVYQHLTFLTQAYNAHEVLGIYYPSCYKNMAAQGY